MAKGDKPVYAFAWSMYHNGTTLLDPADLQSELEMPYYHGADGVVIWGDPTAFKDPTQFQTFVEKRLGPACLTITKGHCACAESRCHAHGRCVNATACECFPGFSGPTCATSA